MCWTRWSSCVRREAVAMGNRWMNSELTGGRATQAFLPGLAGVAGKVKAKEAHFATMLATTVFGGAHG